MRMELLVFLHGNEIQKLSLEPGQEYFAGRQSDNSIQLNESPGISRKHFKIFFDGDHWQIEVLSKFGELGHLGLRVSQLQVTEDTSFTLGPYEFKLKLDAKPPEEKHLVPSMAQMVDNEPTPAPETGSWDDATHVGRSLALPYIRVSQESIAKDYTLRLEGNLWLAGRDQTCQIVIDDQHASRRQFELAHTLEGYFITDLGSANGTLLNGTPIAPNEPTPIKSGDVISVLATKIFFELRDPEFHKRIQTVPQMAPTPQLPAYKAPPLQSPFPFPQASASGPKAKWQNYLETAKRVSWKEHRVKIVIGVLGLFLIWGIFSSHKPTQSTTAAATDPFSKLTPDQRQLVKDSYELARNLAAQRKWQMAMDQLKKIDQLAPGYQDTKQMEQEIQRAIEVREDADEMAREDAQKQQMEAKISMIIQNCRQTISDKTTVPQMQQCLLQVQEFDPGNADAQALIAQVDAAATERARKAEEREDFHRRVHHMEEVCREAVAKYKVGQMYNARKEYERCIHSDLPDPEGARARAKRELASIDSDISSRVNSLLKSASDAFAQANYKGSLSQLEQIRQIDPDNLGYKKLYEQVRVGADTKMHSLYDDSELEESLGQIDAAKAKWQQIIDMNLQESDYYRRAKQKLKRYGVL